MKITSVDTIFSLLRMYLVSAALGTAMELRLFWRLAEKPGDAESLSKALGIPFDRCRSWLNLLTSLGLLVKDDNIYSPSLTTRTFILDAYSSETWKFLAREERERYPIGKDLAVHITHPDSVWAAQGLENPNYIAKMAESPERAEQFTRMLYELHLPLAEQLAIFLDLTGVNRIMDLGGGSGVISHALLRRHSHMSSVVVDIPSVCVVGRELARETTVKDRIIYHAADFLRDDLPTGFDMIIECDVGIYNEDLFRKIYNSLKDEGKFIIVGWWAQPEQEPNIHRPIRVFSSSLETSEFKSSTTAKVKSLLSKAGFHKISEQTLHYSESMIDGIVYNYAVIIQAIK